MDFIFGNGLIMVVEPSGGKGGAPVPWANKIKGEIKIKVLKKIARRFLFI